MAKVLNINYEKCTGCRLCELVCSVSHAGVSNPTKSNIHVIKWEDQGFYMPISCQHCVDAPCMSVCPKHAISRDESLARVMVNYDLCIGCRACVAACPFGAMGFNPDEKKVIKCDLCDGEPNCAKFCDVKAVEYVEANTLNMKKMRDIGKHFEELRVKAWGPA